MGVSFSAAGFRTFGGNGILQVTAMHTFGTQWRRIGPLAPAADEAPEGPRDQIEDVTITGNEFVHAPGGMTHRAGRQVADSGAEEAHRRVKGNR
jgi:hypothetical protein